MNIIPSIFNENLIPYAAVGGKEKNAPSGISLVVLNPQNHPNRSIFKEVENTGFDKVISIETAAPHYDIEELSSRFPFARFILPKKKINLGEQINLAASEVSSPLFLVIKSGINIIAGGSARRMAERELERENIRLCSVPVIVNSNYEQMPTIANVFTKKKNIRVTMLEPQTEGDISLFPFKGIGIYSLEKFKKTGGFDPAINKDYWQLMDFGFRAFLWGEEIALNLHLKFLIEGEMEADDATAGACYRRFVLKNLSPVYKNDHAHLPYYRFNNYRRLSGIDLFSALKEYKEGRIWVKKNKYRWKLDASDVINKWSAAN